jgi:hypothetical protein
MSEPTESPARDQLDALQGSHRGKTGLLVGVLLVALAAAAWSLWPSGGIGNADDPAKILVVTEDGNLEPYLQRLGFDADAQTFDSLEAKAHAEVDDLDVEGAAAIVAFADQFGFGYVVFEHPQRVEWASLQLDPKPSFGDDVRYAAVSVGDLAGRTKMTSGERLLDALFAQDRLAALVPPNEPSDVADVELRDKLREAVDAAGRRAKLRGGPAR